MENVRIYNKVSVEFSFFFFEKKAKKKKEEKIPIALKFPHNNSIKKRTKKIFNNTKYKTSKSKTITLKL